MRLYDTARRGVLDFEPLEPGRVGIYLCGATVQSPPHIGHVRSGLAFDVLRRWLTATGHEVTFVRNVTDIDDKILTKSAEAGQPWWAWAAANERAFTEAYDVLGCLPPTYEPRATGHATEMVELIERLVEAGHAYSCGGGNVYFDVRSWPRYGELTRQRLDDLEPSPDPDPAELSQRPDPDPDTGTPPGKRDPRDFALWKGAKPSEPADASWPTPWGRGRPGWHLECSAMARRYLGATFDIHGGGIDLRFPHHENELAQSAAAGDGFARWWLHNGWVTTGGEKMSKSLGNSLLVSEVVQRVRPIELRYYLLAAHYRSNIEYSEAALHEAAAAFRRIEGFLERAVELSGQVEPGLTCADFVHAMDDDLGVPAALAAVFEVVRAGNGLLAQGDSPALRGVQASVRGMLAILGLDPYAEPWASRAGGEDDQLRAVVGSLVSVLLEQRSQARQRRDYVAADAIRDRLAETGLVVEDTPNGVRWTLSSTATEGAH